MKSDTSSERVRDTGLLYVAESRKVMDTSDLKVLFVAGFGPITRTPADSRKFYKETLGLPLEQVREIRTEIEHLVAQLVEALDREAAVA